MAFSRLLTVSVVVADTTAATTLQASATHNGVTFTFDRPMPVGQFVTGEPFVVSDQAFAITAISPASGVVNGAWAHGAMKDPFFGNSGPQGFDGLMDTSNLVRLTYGNNIDPGATSAAIGIALGEETTLVKAVRRAAVTSDNQWQTIEKYVPLTVLSVAPPAGCFRPTMSGTTKRLHTVGDIDWSVFRSLDFGALGASPASLLGDLPLDPGNFGMTGEYHRRLRLDATAGHGLTAGNYSADIAPAYGKACLALHNAAYTQAQKQDLLYRLITWAIQLEGLYDRGWRGIGGIGGGAGQSFAWAPYFYTGAFALGSASMLAKAVAVSQPADNCQWITAARLDTSPGEQSGNRGLPFFDEHVNVPFCFPDKDIGSQFFSRYGYIAAYGMLWDYAPVILLQNGPSGETGFSARNQGAAGTGNDKSAVWALNDRTVTLNPWLANGYNPITSQADDFWKTVVQPSGAHTPWTGVPEMIAQGGNGAASQYYGDNGDFFTATTGGFSWNFSAYDYATEAKTGRAFRYSLDGTQWIVDDTVADSDSIAGLLRGTAHHLAFRWQSASGWGAWGPNYRTLDNDITTVVPNVISTLGSETAVTPSFTVNPVIHAKIKDVWGNQPGNWGAAPSTLGVDQVDLKAGLGYTNSPVTSWAFQWKRNGTPISGATSQTYTRVAADAGATLTCDITPTNPAGTGPTFTTAGVTCPALTVLPSTTLIDTNFRGAFAVDYEAEVAATTTSNAAFVHSPAGTFSIVGLNAGFVRADKTGAAPRFQMPLQNPAVAGTTYTITAQVLTQYPDFGSAGFNGTLTIQIRNATGTVFWSGTFTPSSTKPEAIGDFADSFTIPGGETDLDLLVRCSNSSGSGGIDGGDPGLSLLRIAAV